MIKKNEVLTQFEAIVEKNKQLFVDLLNKHVVSERKNQLPKLIKWLEEETDFFYAPASAKYHNNCDGGLCWHSLNVLKRKMRLSKLYCSERKCEYTKQMMEEDTVCSLLHDVCKTNFYEKGRRNKQNEDGQWIAHQIYTYNDENKLGHGECSVILLLTKAGFSLTDTEIQAIFHHMGDYTTDRSCSEVFSENISALNLHLADLQATHMDEKAYDLTI